MLDKIKRAFFTKAKTFALKFIAPIAAKIMWQKIKKQKKPDTIVFICAAAMGDQLYCLSFMEEIKKAHPSNKLIVVTFEKFKRITDLFDSYDEVFFVPNKGLRWFEIKCIVANLGYAEKMFDDGIVIVPYGIMAKSEDPVKNNTDYISAIRDVFGLAENAPLHYHNMHPAEVKSIPDFDTNSSTIVILNPYSNSAEISKNGLAFFEHVCDILKEKGYIVYTNVINSQKPISGSLELRCSLEEMLGIAAKIPLIVSLRSGILDLLVPTGVNMFVIYNNHWHFIWYKMDKWGGQNLIKEFLYDEATDKPDRLVDEFIKYLKNISQ